MKEFFTRILNRLLRRRCADCRYWSLLDVFGRGKCRYRSYFSPPEGDGRRRACGHYERRG